jgi:hypothetical protein
MSFMGFISINNDLILILSLSLAIVAQILAAFLKKNNIFLLLFVIGAALSISDPNRVV